MLRVALIRSGLSLTGAKACAQTLFRNNQITNSEEAALIIPDLEPRTPPNLIKNKSDCFELFSVFATRPGQNCSLQVQLSKILIIDVLVGRKMEVNCLE
jgi:hypothetical protein